MSEDLAVTDHGRLPQGVEGTHALQMEAEAEGAPESASPKDGNNKDPDWRQGGSEARNSSRTPSVSSRQSIHVAIPPNVRPGEKFFVVVDDMEYEVIAPDDCSPGEMIAMDIMPSGHDLEYEVPYTPPAITITREPEPVPMVSSKADVEYESDSIATDASLVHITVPDHCKAGDTFLTAVNGLEFEILVPKDSKPGDVIVLEVPSKHAIGKFAAPESSESLTSPSILVRDGMGSQDSNETDVFAEIAVPVGAIPGQTFVAVIDGVEFDVPVPDGYGPGEVLTLQIPSRGFGPSPVPTELAEMRRELREVKQELAEVRSNRQVHVRDDDRQHLESKSSHDSNFIEILIPPDCHAGDSFIVEVDDVEFEMAVPEGCTPGETIYMDLREGAGPLPATQLSSKQKSASRPASAVRKKLLEGLKMHREEQLVFLSRQPHRHLPGRNQP